MRYHVVTDGEWVAPRMKGYLFRCCDCRLVHRINFKVTSRGVMFQAFRLRKRKMLTAVTMNGHHTAEMKITRDSVTKVVIGLLETDARKATLFLDETTVVKATRRHRPNKRERTTEISLTLGAPNHREREFIKSCKKSKEPFPVKKLQLRFWPKR